VAEPVAEPAAEPAVEPATELETLFGLRKRQEKGQNG